MRFQDILISIAQTTASHVFCFSMAPCLPDGCDPTLHAEEPDLNSRKDTEFLLRFLRVRKYNVEAALQTIRNYYYNRSTCDSLYRDLLPSTVPLEARKLITVMPGKDVQGRNIILCNLGAWMPKRISQATFQRACILCLELLASDPSAQTLGIVLLIDCSEFAVENALCFKPGLVKKGLEYMQDCMPSRLKMVHVVRQAHAFDVLYAIMKPFLKSKLAGRFRFHGHNFESLHKEISPENLPQQLGGLGPPLDYDGFWNEMNKLEKTFEAENRYGYSNKYNGDFATNDEIEKDLDFF
ncbi:hypothetical protein V5799_006691 [Amblyomma americanum]|uniref:CRAL-TRIO domain-containing protein n=1 Tax=Amblyomma americanum TaxID=6943 RepID=A0AAQ4DVN6_AMBAM